MQRTIQLTLLCFGLMAITSCRKPSVEDLQIVSIEKKERISRYEVRYTCKVILNYECEELWGGGGYLDYNDKTGIIKFTGVKHELNCKKTAIETSAQTLVDLSPMPGMPNDTGVYTLHFFSGNAQFFSDTVHVK